jgi:ABC-type multidrug transport system permease subunit
MRTSPTFMGLLYLSLGVLFTYLAIENDAKSMWNATTIIFMLLATFDFAVSIRFFILRRKLNIIKKNKST